MASAQVKSCVLLAGLRAEGETVVREPVPTRLHTEEMLALCGADMTVEDGDDGSHVVRLRESEPAAVRDRHPRGPVTGRLLGGGRLHRARAATSPWRGSTWVRAGGAISTSSAGWGPTIDEVAETARADLGATASLRARYGPLRATAIDAAEITGLDEVPVLAVAAACAEGTTVFFGMGELRVKESDRLTAVADPRPRLRRIGRDRRRRSGRARADDAIGRRLRRRRATTGWPWPRPWPPPPWATPGATPSSSSSAASPRWTPATRASPTTWPGWPADRGREGLVTKIVAIDGPAGAGKSTLAQAVAEHLGLERLDSGAMYRAVAWQALAEGLDPDDTEAVAALARRLDIQVGDRVTVDGIDVTDEIRTEQVDRAVSAVAANPAVRTTLVDRQRRWVSERGAGVVEGRDIGTVVLPDADIKVYLTARTGERARRRAEERADGRSVAEIEADLERRDRLDSTRSVSPLIMPEDVADDAVIIDSTGKSADQVLREVLRCL